MTHHFEFVAKLKNGDTIHQYYKGEHSRHRKVVQAIQKDLFNLYKVLPIDIEDFWMKPIDKPLIK